MPTIYNQEIFMKKSRQKQNFDSDLKEAWHYNHVTFTLIAKNFMLYCRLIYMLSMLYVGLTIKVKVEIPESFKAIFSLFPEFQNRETTDQIRKVGISPCWYTSKAS